MASRIFLTLFVYLISLALFAITSFLIVIFLAGPHAGLLPGWIEVIVICLGWLAVLILPIVTARKVWKGKKPHISGKHDAP